MKHSSAPADLSQRAPRLACFVSRERFNAHVCANLGSCGLRPSAAFLLACRVRMRLWLPPQLERFATITHVPGCGGGLLVLPTWGAAVGGISGLPNQWL